MIFLGSKHCPRCGAAALVPETTAAEETECPRCKVQMKSVAIGSTTVSECEQCLGLWLNVAAFEGICADREQQSAVLGTASPAPSHAVRETSKVNYVPCPQCSQLMNRINFARCSGVIVDVCKGHGTWFDRDELSRIVEFIRGGGLEESRNREKEDIKEERLKLLEQQRVEARRSILTGRDVDDQRIPAIVSAQGLLKFLLDS
ncbi:MAG TPA: zf-TFIIB domain-containing protein [Pyrinomonadaceae bacterium]|nr:zf-TFIIB domain-containing protein [Pyrinomonadaceae bacterium]